MADSTNPPNALHAADRDDGSALPSQVMSFGTFKPVGHVLIGITGAAATAALGTALRRAGLDAGLVWVTPSESAAELQALIDNASPLAGFGYEITLMRRYLELSASGHRWLLVPVADDAAAQQVGEAARAAGATLAVRYGTFIVEELV
jgi:hypothetical protein